MFFVLSWGGDKQQEAQRLRRRRPTDRHNFRDNFEVARQQQQQQQQQPRRQGHWHLGAGRGRPAVNYVSWSRRKRQRKKCLMKIPRTPLLSCGSRLRVGSTNNSAATVSPPISIRKRTTFESVYRTTELAAAEKPSSSQKHDSVEKQTSEFTIHLSKFVFASLSVYMCVSYGLVWAVVFGGLGF